MNGRITTKGYTLLEITLAVSILVGVVFVLWRLVDAISDNRVQDNVVEIVNSELHNIQNVIKDDLSLIVFLKKKHPVFEIKAKERGDGYVMSFFTTNTQEHVTVAVQYDVHVIDYGKIQFSRIEIKPEQSLIMQQKFIDNQPLVSLFDSVNEEFKTVRKFGIYLSSCVICPSIRMRYNRIVSPVRAMTGNVVYKNGTLFYMENGNQESVIGNIAFFDVYLSALTQFDQNKIAKIYRKNSDMANDFVLKKSRRRFLRVVPMTSGMW